MDSISKELEKGSKPLAGLIDMLQDIQGMLGAVIRGFNQHDLSALKEAEEIGKRIDRKEKELTPLILESSQSGDEIDRQLINFPGYMERMGDNLESILNTIRTKIKDGILFSDKAVNEINDLFDKTAELVNCIKDLLLTHNPVLLNYVIEKGAEYYNLATDYETEHEERLIKGVCLPRSSPIYLDIIDSLKEIVWYVGRMGDGLKKG